jgi:hypothetical protein
MAGFPHLLLKNHRKRHFITEKYLTKYTPETFFEEYINFTIFCYFRRCGVICTFSKILEVISASSRTD